MYIKYSIARSLYGRDVYLLLEIVNFSVHALQYFCCSFFPCILYSCACTYCVPSYFPTIKLRVRPLPSVCNSLVPRLAHMCQLLHELIVSKGGTLEMRLIILYIVNEGEIPLSLSLSPFCYACTHSHTHTLIHTHTHTLTHTHTHTYTVSLQFLRRRPLQCQSNKLPHKSLTVMSSAANTHCTCLYTYYMYVL